MKLIVYLILLINTVAYSSTKQWNAKYFENITNEERFHFVHDFEYWKVSNPDTLQHLFKQMWEIADKQTDIRTTLAINYYCTFSYLTPGFTIPFNKSPEDLLNEMNDLSEKYNFEVEQIISDYYRQDIQNKAYPESYTKNQYQVVVKSFERMQTIGFN